MARNRAERDETEQDEGDLAEGRGKSKKVGTCYVCEEEGKGKAYHFWAGFELSSSRKTNFMAGTVSVTASYRDLQKYGIFLCRDCAVSLWRKKYLKTALGFAIPMILCIIGSVIVKLKAPENLGQPMSIVLLIIAGVFGIFFAMEFWKVLSPSLYRPSMEYLVIDLVRPDYADRGDTFFTTDEQKALFR
jgi:hypothetical protein